MVNKKAARNNNRSCKKPAPKEGKLLTNSDKLIQNVSNTKGEKLSKEQKDHIKLSLAFVKKNQESINSGIHFKNQFTALLRGEERVNLDKGDLT